MKRLWVMPTIGALLTLPCGAYVLGDDVPPPPRTMDQLEELFARERAIYENAGLRRVDSGTASFGDEIRVMLEGGQCIGIVTASESAWPAVIHLHPRDEQELLTRSDRTHVASVSWCDPYALPLRIVLDGDWQSYLPPTAQSRLGTIHYEVFAGRTDAFDLTTLPRGQPNEVIRGQVLARMEAERAIRAERAGLPATEPLLAAVNLATDSGALLVPRSDATWTTYRRAMTRFLNMSVDDAHPRVHPSSVGPHPEHDVATSEGIVSLGTGDEASLWRVLAVVDPADLPIEDGRVPCGIIRFGRLGPEGVEVRRWDLVDAQPITTSGIAAMDSFCHSDPIRLYLVPVADTYEYVARFLASEAAGPAAPRRSGNPLEAPPYAPLVEALAACEERAERCLEAARELRDGAHVPVDEPEARELLRNVCTDDVDACGEYAEHLIALDDAELAREAASVLRRACDESRWDACARLGDLRRLGVGSDADYDDAYALYRRACMNGVEGACTNSVALVNLYLVNPSGSETDAEDAPGVTADE